MKEIFNKWCENTKPYQKLPSNEQIIKDLKNLLPEKRYLHTLRVKDVAISLALKFHQDVQKVETAALLHDAAKGMDNTELLSFARLKNITLSKEDQKSLGVIHNRVGVFLAKNYFLCEDIQIHHAIFYHTTGPLVDEMVSYILFLADFLDPKRDILEKQKTVYDYLDQDKLYEALLMVSIYKIEFVLQKQVYLHPDSLSFYNKMQMKVFA